MRTRTSSIKPLAAAAFGLLLPSLLWAKSESISGINQRALRFIEAQQIKGESGFYVDGQWPSQLTTYHIPALIGVGKLFARPTEEPTAFTTAAVANLISEAYLSDHRLQTVPKLVQSAVASFEGFREDGKFIYYPKFLYKGVWVRGPQDPGYAPDFLRGFLYTPPDADTTSVAHLALAYNQSFGDGQPLSAYQVPSDALTAFSIYRDVGRNPHLLNRWQAVSHTGAFLTWLHDEKTSSLLKSVTDAPAKGARIAFYKNEVDCVVNANVLRLLAATDNQEAAGFQNSCAVINDIIIREKQKYCSSYYPNSYNLFSSASSAFRAGANCLISSRQKAIDMITSTQNEEGSWQNEEGIGRIDYVHSTAWAISALMNYDDGQAKKYSFYVEKGVRFLISKMKSVQGQQVYWPAEVFFAGGAFARNTVLWRSDAYTTALVMATLAKAEAYLGQEHL